MGFDLWIQYWIRNYLYTKMLNYEKISNILRIGKKENYNSKNRIQLAYYDGLTIKALMVE